MAVWPASLPQKFQDGSDYQETPENTVLRSTMDTGVIKLRRRQTRSISRLSGTMLLSAAQASDFIFFFQDTIKGGSLTFTGSLGRNELNQTYQFSEEPSLTNVGGLLYSVNLKLIVLP